MMKRISEKSVQYSNKEEESFQVRMANSSKREEERDSRYSESKATSFVNDSLAKDSNVDQDCSIHQID